MNIHKFPFCMYAFVDTNRPYHDILIALLIDVSLLIAIPFYYKNTSGWLNPNYSSMLTQCFVDLTNQKF